MKTEPAEPSAESHVGSKWLSANAVAGAVLIGLSVLFLAASWRKWPDSLIDFGRELYLPWQLSQGAVLYRDAEDFYGPLSQYFNALLFKFFGPGMMVLVAANLVVFAAIVALIYALFRRAWGPVAALACGAIFIAIFGFSDTTGLGNYNYATPYSHEATHGLLACLALVYTLVRWLERPTSALSFAAGLLAGVTTVLKPEILLAALCVTAAGVWLGRRRVQRTHAGSWMLGLALPTVAFIIYFSLHVPLSTAMEYAGRAWLSVVSSTRFTGDPSQLAFLGFDQPWGHVVEHFTATTVALGLLGLIVGGACLGERHPRYRLPMAALTAGCVAGLAIILVPWESAGRSLLGLLLLYWIAFRPAGARLLLTVLGVTLLARMALNGRLHQFGFYQAAIATLVVVAVMIDELPAKLRLGAPGRRAFHVGLSCLILPGVATLVLWSQQLLAQKTYPVGTGRDKFYAVDPSRDKTGDLVNAVSSELRRAAPGQTLLVLPDGEMINYLARMRSPVAPAFFFSSATVGGREATIVADLERHPPDWILLISRDLTEFGITHYGESQGQGKLILEWARRDYELAGEMGGDPLQPPAQGIRLLRRRVP